MSTTFNCCDSVSRYIFNNNDTDAVIGKIRPSTTLDEFEQLCKAHPQFQLNRCNKYLDTILHKAAQENNVTLIKYIVKRAPQLLERGGSSQKTALWQAAIADKLEAVETLLELGANPNITARGTTDLVEVGNFEGVDRRILNVIIFKQLVLTDREMLSKQSRIIKLLVKNGAEISTESYRKETQLKINLIFENVSKEVAKEREEIAKTINNYTPLISDLSRLISEY